MKLTIDVAGALERITRARASRWPPQVVGNQLGGRAAIWKRALGRRRLRKGEARAGSDAMQIPPAPVCLASRPSSLAHQNLHSHTHIHPLMHFNSNRYTQTHTHTNTKLDEASTCLHHSFALVRQKSEKIPNFRSKVASFILEEQ